MTHKVRSVSNIGDVFDIFPFESKTTFDDEITKGYAYISKDGFFKTDWNSKQTMFSAHDLTTDNVVMACESDKVYFVMPDGKNSFFISFKRRNSHQDFEIITLGVTPGRFLSACVYGGYIYAYTTEGVFRNYYPHLDYIDSRKHP